jgi:hypothetical protein
MPGEPLCPFPDCYEPVFALDEATGEGWCAVHLELVIERWLAVELEPSMRETLPPLYELVV